MVLLVISLALNLVALGAIGTRAFVNERIERLAGPSHTQLVPRRFLADISKQRREELRQVFRGYRGAFRESRESLRAAALGLAGVLEASPTDDPAIAAKIDAFANAGTTIIGEGAKAARDMVAKLTPEERKLLGKRIRERAEVRRR
jgi:Spy/CpxP family protein refolding chaperone